MFPGSAYNAYISSCWLMAFLGLLFPVEFQFSCNFSAGSSLAPALTKDAKECSGRNNKETQALKDTLDQIHLIDV